MGEQKAVSISGPQQVVRRSDTVFGKFRLAMQRRSMNRDLARWFAAAKDFKANGLPAGSDPYQLLYQQSTERIRQLSATWNIAIDKIACEMPGLYTLQKLAHPQPKPTRNPALAAHPLRTLLVVMVFLTLVLCLGAAALGGASGIYHLVERSIVR